MTLIDRCCARFLALLLLTAAVLPSPRAASAAGEIVRGEGDVSLLIGAETNSYRLQAARAGDELKYVALYDAGGPVEATLQDRADTFVWTRGIANSNSWTLYVAGKDSMPQLKEGPGLNHLTYRWFLLQDVLSPNTGGSRFEAIDPDGFRLLHPKEGTYFSTARQTTNGIEMTYFDFWTMPDGTRITNFAGHASIQAETTEGESVRVAVAGNACSASKVFTNVRAELTARLAYTFDNAGPPRYPSLSTNYGMVVDYRKGARLEYGLSNLTAASWPVTPLADSETGLPSWTTRSIWTAMFALVALAVMMVKRASRPTRSRE